MSNACHVKQTCCIICIPKHKQSLRKFCISPWNNFMNLKLLPTSRSSLIPSSISSLWAITMASLAAAEFDVRWARTVRASAILPRASSHRGDSDEFIWVLKTPLFQSDSPGRSISIIMNVMAKTIWNPIGRRCSPHLKMCQFCLFIVMEMSRPSSYLNSQSPCHNLEITVEKKKKKKGLTTFSLGICIKHKVLTKPGRHPKAIDQQYLSNCNVGTSMHRPRDFAVIYRNSSRVHAFMNAFESEIKLKGFTVIYTVPKPCDDAADNQLRDSECWCLQYGPNDLRTYSVSYILPKFEILPELRFQ